MKRLSVRKFLACVVVSALVATASVQLAFAQNGGCTRTPGYWKTHSHYGPAPYDDTWGVVPLGADGEFLTSTLTFYDVLWTAPKAGNVYFILAHQYIAAALNGMSGASMPGEVLNALGAAASLLEECGPDTSIPKSSPQRALAIALAEILDEYNSGYLGPGSCECPCWTDEELSNLNASSCVETPDGEYISVATAENFVLSTSDSEFPECNVVDHNLNIGFALAIAYGQFLDCREGLEALIGAAGLMCSEPW